MSPKTRLKEKERKLARRSYQEAVLGLGSFDDNNIREVVNVEGGNTRSNAVLTPSNRTKAQLQAFPNRNERYEEAEFSEDLNSQRSNLDRMTTSNDNANTLPESEHLFSSLGNRLDDMKKTHGQ